eukprot:1037278-Pleurochrysis_carterae.AAC.2
MDLSATGYCTKGRSCNDGHASACPLLGTAGEAKTTSASIDQAVPTAFSSRIINCRNTLGIGRLAALLVHAHSFQSLTVALSIHCETPHGLSLSLSFSLCTRFISCP